MKKHTLYKALTIAGFDGSGGAGIQADLKTFSALGCYGTTVLTSLPAQNTLGVRSIYDLTLPCIEDQLKTILDDISMDSVKIGMLHRQDIVELVADTLSKYQIANIVLDPVMVAKSGDLLLLPDAIISMKEKLFPMATIVTPNLPEASALVGYKVETKEDMEKAAKELLTLGPQAVVIKGGHLQGSCDDCLCLRIPNMEIHANDLKNCLRIHWLSSPRIHTKNTHGTGCTFSAAIAAYLARGYSILDAVYEAKEYLTKAVEAGAHLKIGQGNGPVHHFHHLWNLLNSN